MRHPKTESSRAAAAFDAYLALGPGRSLDKLTHQSAPKGTPGLDTLKAWSVAFHWVERARAYDATHLAQQRVEREAAEKADRARILTLRFTDRERRVQALIDEYEDLQTIKRERAATEVELAARTPKRALPGMTTGQMVRRKRAVGRMTVEEAAIDDARIARSQALLKQIAQELGEWSERHELTGKDGKDLSALVTVYIPENHRDARVDSNPAASRPSGEVP